MIRNKLWMDKVCQQTLENQERNEKMILETMRKDILYTAEQVQQKILNQGFRINHNAVTKALSALVAQHLLDAYRDIENVKHFLKKT